MAVLALAAGAAIAGCAALAAQLSDNTPQRDMPSIEAGTCLRSNDLAQGALALHELDTISCAHLHDAEVFAVQTMRPGEDLDAVGERCMGAASDRGFDGEQLQSRELEIRPLALTNTPHSGDTVACFIRHQSGTPLRGVVFTPRD